VLLLNEDVATTFCAYQHGGATYNLRQIQRVIPDGVEDEILQAIDDVEQLLAQRSHGAGCVLCGAPNGPGCPQTVNKERR